MLEQDRHKRLYHLHSASGIWLGLFLYFVAITGCFALFHSEMHSWEDPAQRVAIADEPIDIDPIFDAWIKEKAEKAKVTFVRFNFPTEEHPYFLGFIGTQAEGEKVQFHEAHWHTATGEALPVRSEGANDWLFGIHRDLNWPDALGGRQIGRALVGIAGIVLLASIITGVLIHRKIFKELFSLRFYRSVRLRWQDSHKIIGVWGLPPFAMFALTGAFLGIITLLGPATAFLTVKGDQEALVAAVVGEQTSASGTPAQTLLPTQIAALPNAAEPLSSPDMIIYRHWGDANAEAAVSYKADKKLMIYNTYLRNGVTGEELPLRGELDTSRPALAVIGSYSTLHYGTYGGIALKFLYFFVGLLLSIMVALGLMLWTERRLHGSEGSKTVTFYRRISHLITGLTLGVPLATAVVLGYDKLYTGAEEARYDAMGWAYFAVIVLAGLFAFVRRQDYRAARELMMLTGAAFTALPLINTLVTGGSALDVFGSGHHVAAYADITFIVMGLVTVFTGYRMPKQRTQQEAKSKNVPMDDDIAPIEEDAAAVVQAAE